MMSVLEYALDIKKDVKDVLKQCKKLGIEVSNEEDMLEDENIILLDNIFTNETIEEVEEPTEDEELENIAHDLISSSNVKLDDTIKKEKLAKKKDFVSNKDRQELDAKKKEMYKHKEKLVTNVADSNVISFKEDMTVLEFAKELGVEASAIVKKLIGLGEMLTINAPITFEMAEVIALDYKKELKKEETMDESNFEQFQANDKTEDLIERAPVVTIMGHVDHGKTSLLDSIRKARVVEGEAGGITQHIGAYQVLCCDKKITFIDTPGHSAFTEMRARGAGITDIVIIVVAADDGVMPQTKEAIEHAKEADVPIIVAINKIDKPGLNLEKLYADLSTAGLTSEEWGGDTIFVKISALTGEGIESLLENILLVAEMKELKANPHRYAMGVVIESKMDKNIGSIVTLLIQNGTLRLGDPIVVGSCFGKIRTMKNDLGKEIVEALPSTPASITGLNDVACAGDRFMAFETEKQARSIANQRKISSREKAMQTCAVSLEDMFTKIEAGAKEVKVVLKADVKGSEEAVKNSLLKIDIEGSKVNVIRSGIGAISESDVTLAAASNAIIIGFNVKTSIDALETATRCVVDIRLYDIIYKAVEEIEAAMLGMLDPEYEEKVLGQAEVRKIFKFSKVGSIAGSYVLDGIMKRDAKARVLRDNEVIFDGKISTLQREKDQAKEVKAGLECGITIDNFNDLKEGDIVEAYDLVVVERK